MICYLIRHGKDDETIRGGWSKASLSDEGRLQAINLAKIIRESELMIDKLFSSDLPRAIETAKPIAKILNLETNLKPEFRETNNGLLAGMPHELASKKYPGLFWSTLGWDEPYPQGESPHGFYKRIKTAWEEFSIEILKENKNVILVTHNGVINVIFSLIENRPFSNKSNMEKVPHATIVPLESTFEGGGHLWSKSTPKQL